MRLIYEMPSNNVKVWKDKTEIVLSVCGEQTTLSEWEVKDLINTLIALNVKEEKSK